MSRWDNVFQIKHIERLVERPPPPPGPQIDFLILKSHNGTTWTPGIISITMGPLCSCMLFWFPYVMAGYCFQYVNDVFSCRNMVFEVISRSEFGSSIFSGEGEGAEVLKCNFHS